MKRLSTVENPDVAKAVSAARRLAKAIDQLSESYGALAHADRAELAAMQGQLAAASHRLDVARTDQLSVTRDVTGDDL